MKTGNLIVIFVFACAFTGARAAEVKTPAKTKNINKPHGKSKMSSEEMSLATVLKIASAESPRVRSARYEIEAAKQAVTTNKAGYLPEIDAAAVAQTGDPGSFGFMGVSNDLSASQRIGAGGALVLKQDIWDFGRTSSNVKTAEAQQKLSGQILGLVRADVAQQVLKTYVDCAYLKTQVEDSRFIAEQASMVAKETTRFVNSGQRSVVERDLVDAQAQEAETLTAELTERVRVIEQRLAIELNRPPTQPVHCMNLDTVAGAMDSLVVGSDPNPVIQAEQTRVEVAQSRLEGAKSGNLPTLVGLATGGYFDNDNLKNKWNYSAGVGISIPLFAGFGIESNIDREAAQLQAAQANLASSQQAVDRTNSTYDEKIQSLRVRLDFLEKENKLAKQVFELARKRYLSFQGNMIDLREAIKNISRVLMSTDEAYRDLDLAMGERALFNGAPIPEESR